MRRWILVVLALVAVAALGPGRADAKTPCRDKIYNEWYHDGKVASTYPLSCYRDAIKHVPVQDAVYTSLSDDIRLALQAAIARSHGKQVPREIAGDARVTSSGKPSQSTGSSSSGQASKDAGGTAPDSPDPGEMTTTTTPASTTPVAVAASSTSSSGGLPVPVLVLGGVALLLLASGIAGVVLRRYRRGQSI